MNITIIRNSGALALALVTFWRAPLFSQQSQGVFSRSDLPLSVLEGGMGGKLRYGMQSGDVRYRAGDRTVTVTWTASAIENQEPNYSLPVDFARNAIGGAVASTSDQLFSTAYYPTACGKLTDNDFLVAGIRPNGVTVVQKWVLVWPATMPGYVADPATGLIHVDVVFPTVQKTTVYVAPSSLEIPRYVGAICGLRRQGNPERAIIRFVEPHNDVMTLDLATGALSLVASHVNSSGPLGVVSSLSIDGYREISVRNKVNAGYCYRFWRIPEVPSVNDAPILVLIDADRDGTIDSAAELSQEEFASQGFEDLGNYVSYWMD